jgi:hypothetical protein
VLETSGGVLGVSLEAISEVLKAVLGVAERVSEVVLDDTAELLPHKTDVVNVGLTNAELPKLLAVEMVATPIVLLAVKTEAFREKAVAKGARG